MKRIAPLRIKKAVLFVITIATLPGASSFAALLPASSFTSSASTVLAQGKDTSTSTSTLTSTSTSTLTLASALASRPKLFTPFTSTRLYSSISSTATTADADTHTDTNNNTDTGAKNKASSPQSLSPSQSQSQPQSLSALSPAEYENQKFNCDETVEFWNNFQKSGLYTPSENIRDIIAVSNRFVAKGGDALNYWLRHNARSGYFFTNAVLGVTASNLHEQLMVRSSSLDSNTKSNSNTNSNDSTTTSNSPTFANSLIRSQVITRLILEVAITYEQDYRRIEGRKYKLPHDMYDGSLLSLPQTGVGGLQLQLQQSSPLYALDQTSRFVREAVGTLTRRNRGSDDDKRIWISSSSNSNEDIGDTGIDDAGVDTTSDLYPEYYRTAFHYQTDGWMSSDSANVYDTSTETLFLGRQDAMQRTALVPLLQRCAELGKQQQKQGQRPMKVLEVACGTGRFMTFARDNLPPDAEYTALDLSPYYLDRARKYDAEWRSLRQRRNVSEDSGTSTSTTATTRKDKNKIQPASIVQGQAENLPFRDNEFDAVVCIYLFHELPRNIRAKVAREMARVTKAGGTVILTDSTQIGDRPVFDGQIGNFEKMNEPYYKDYIVDYLPDHFESAGMECMTKTVCSASKTLAFRKKVKEETS